MITPIFERMDMHTASFLTTYNSYWIQQDWVVLGVEVEMWEGDGSCMGKRNEVAIKEGKSNEVARKYL